MTAYKNLTFPKGSTPLSRTMVPTGRKYHKLRCVCARARLRVSVTVSVGGWECVCVCGCVWNDSGDRITAEPVHNQHNHVALLKTTALSPAVRIIKGK